MPINMSVIPGEFGTTIIHDDGHREQTQQEREGARRADRYPYNEVLRDQRWTAADLELAKKLAFPAALGTQLFSGGTESFYSRRQVAQWAEQLKAFAAKVK